MILDSKSGFGAVIEEDPGLETLLLFRDAFYGYLVAFPWFLLWLSLDGVESNDFSTDFDF